MSSSCPSLDQLKQLLDDDSSTSLLRATQAHVNSCVACQTTLAEIGSDETDVAKWRQLLRDGGSQQGADESLTLHRALEYLKRHPPEEARLSGAGDPATEIQFPGLPTGEAPLGQLGDYDILEELGSGAYGTVFKGFDRRLRREVAIKVLNPDHAAVHRDRERFQVEARVVSGLQHEHIVRIFDVCAESEFPLPYLVMEFVNGQSLAEHLAAKAGAGHAAFEPWRAARVVKQVALGLGAAHATGVVHRDIKSSNIVLENGTGRAKVTDFGLARQLLAPSDSNPFSGRVIGTFPYMSPEQILFPDQVDARSDLYSLGVVFYELLTGERPFRGTSSALMLQVVHDDPQPLRKLNPTIPRDLETICRKCLEKEPAKRYATADALAEELQRFLVGEPIRARPVPFWERAAKWAKRQPSVAALLAAVVLVTFLGFAGITWQWSRAEQRGQEARWAQVTAERARDREHTVREQVEKNLYFQSIARAHLEWLTNNQARADQLLDDCLPQHRGWEWRYLKKLFHPEIRTLRGHVHTVRRVAFSPDGKLIASTDAIWNQRDPGTVVVWDAHTGEQRQSFLASSGGFYGVDFSPDSKRLAAANAIEGISVWDLTAGREEFRTTELSHFDVKFDPSGKLLAGASTNGNVHVWTADTGALRHALRGHSGNVFSVAFSPDGTMLASTGHDGKGQIWNHQTGESIRPLPGAGNRCLAFSPDGRFLASCGYAGQDAGIVKVWEVGQQWKEVFVQRVPDGPVNSLSISPDGRFLAFNMGGNSGTVGLFDLTTRQRRSLLHAHSSVTGVAFSPDGRVLATGGTDQVVKLWDMTLQPPVITRQDTAYVSSLAFDPTGPRLALAGGFNSASGRGTKTGQVWNVTQPHQLSLERTLDGHEQWLTSVAYSADGKRVASADRAGIIRIWDPSSGQNVLTMEGHNGAVTSVAFHPDGKRLASGGAKSNIQFWDAETGQTIQSLEGHQGRVNQVVFSPDGSVVASASDDHTARLWDTTTGRVLHTLHGHDGAVRSVAFDSQGQLLATGGDHGLINLWNVRAGVNSASEPRADDRPIRSLRGHTAVVTSVSFSRDNTRLASISDDVTAKIWDVVTGQEALTLTPLASGPALSVAFSTDGNLLAAARGRHVTLWDARAPSEQDAATHAQDTLRRARYWHDDEAAACATSKNWFGEVFHLSQLIAFEPQQPTYYYRRANACANWAESDAGNADRREIARRDYETAIQLSGGLLLAGRGDHLLAPHIPFDQFDVFTMEAWFHGGYGGSIFAQGKSGDPENSIWLSPGGSVDALESHTCGWESGMGENNYISMNSRVPLQWNHVALAYDGSRQRLFLNGKLVNQKQVPKPGTLNRQRMLMIGGHQSGTQELFSTGLLRSVRISKSLVYDSEFTPAETLDVNDNTVLLFDFGKDKDWMASSTVLDLSRNGNNGTLHNAWWSK